MKRLRLFARYQRIFLISLMFTAGVVGAKWLLHTAGFEPIQQTSLHNAMISSAIFVIGFVLSATISDYKESERIPADFGSAVENMYEDAKQINLTYNDFDLSMFRNNLITILGLFREGGPCQSHRCATRDSTASQHFC